MISDSTKSDAPALRLTMSALPTFVLYLLVQFQQPLDDNTYSSTTTTTGL